MDNRLHVRGTHEGKEPRDGKGDHPLFAKACAFAVARGLSVPPGRGSGFDSSESEYTFTKVCPVPRFDNRPITRQHLCELRCLTKESTSSCLASVPMSVVRVTRPSAALFVMNVSMLVASNID